MYFRLKTETQYSTLESLQKELEDLHSEEQRLLQELNSLQHEETATLEAISEQEAEAQRLNEVEERYWKEYTRYRRELMLTDDEYRRLFIHRL